MKFNSSPVGYIVSCSPQAWAAAAPFLFLQTLLGVQPLGGDAVKIEPIQNDLFFRYRIVGMAVGKERISFEVRQGDSPSIRRLDGSVPLLSDTAEIS
jgi:hypothetical protein